MSGCNATEAIDERAINELPKETSPMSHRMKFGAFLAPFHKPGINPTLALEQDLELVQWLDRCGYDEAWFGEHHSAGTEISASP